MCENNKTCNLYLPNMCSPSLGITHVCDNRCVTAIQLWGYLNMIGVCGGRQSLYTSRPYIIDWWVIIVNISVVFLMILVTVDDHSLQMKVYLPFRFTRDRIRELIIFNK